MERMEKYIFAAAVLLAALFVSTLGPLFALETYQYPTIKGYGPIVPLPKAAVQPEPSLTYKVLFDITTKSDKKDKAGTVNAGLSHTARFINTMNSANPGIKKELVVIIHGPATPIVLKNDEYRKKFNKDNPNIPLINALKGQGATIYVCGQALRDNKFEHEWVFPEVTIAISALVVVPTFQLKGYAYQPFF